MPARLGAGRGRGRDEDHDAAERHDREESAARLQSLPARTDPGRLRPPAGAPPSPQPRRAHVTATERPRGRGPRGRGGTAGARGAGGGGEGAAFSARGRPALRSLRLRGAGKEPGLSLPSGAQQPEAVRGARGPRTRSALRPDAAVGAGCVVSRRQEKLPDPLIC